MVTPILGLGRRDRYNFCGRKVSSNVELSSGWRIMEMVTKKVMRHALGRVEMIIYD